MPDTQAPQIIDQGTGLPTGHLEKRTVPVKTTAPPTSMREWVNKRTGEKLMVPDGVDPGWDNNPGFSRRQNLEKMLAGKLDGADPELARIARLDLEGNR